MQILPPTRQPLIVPQEHRPQGDTASDDVPEDIVATATARMIDASDEMSAVLTQFRNRRNFEAQTDNVPGGFEKVLDEDVVPKAQQILAAAKMSDRPVEWLLQMARSLFTDDSDLVLVLRELLRRRDLSPEGRQRLEQMLRTTMSQATPRQLKAGINCALKARLFGKKLGLRATLMRQTYRSFLESEAGPVADYEDWIALYGMAHRSQVLGFVEAALLIDMQAQDPSCSSAEFGDLLGKLGQLKRLRSADASFVTGLVVNHALRERGVDEPPLVVLMLGLLRYPDELDERLQDCLGDIFLPAGHSERASMLGALRQAVARLPQELFADELAQLRIDGRFTALVDIAFDHEAAERRIRDR